MFKINTNQQWSMAMHAFYINMTNVGRSSMWTIYFFYNMDKGYALYTKHCIKELITLVPV